MEVVKRNYHEPILIITVLQSTDGLAYGEKNSKYKLPVDEILHHSFITSDMTKVLFHIKNSDIFSLVSIRVLSFPKYYKQVSLVPQNSFIGRFFPVGK